MLARAESEMGWGNSSKDGVAGGGGGGRKKKLSFLTNSWERGEEEKRLGVGGNGREAAEQVESVQPRVESRVSKNLVKDRRAER